MLNPDSLDEEIKALLVREDKPTLSNSLRSSEDTFLGSLSQSIQSGQADTIDSYEGMSSWTVISDNLAAMENLAQSCFSGRICCCRVIVGYKICQVREAFSWACFSNFIYTGLLYLFQTVLPRGPVRIISYITFV
jgi:hypothetical protein